ncbi:putative mediator of RNA polymerase II transcription subunit 26 [Penaeus chinensis]|uniref:putative mediator of RNA polymerase II transcription subunit 26 n=1 Tax=Penaeus chinensis TaxID=139456 RepID=UPI001FB6123B|nr:putative mediator of RNA polymerase II transcription subunit 26 [Penaeus chinensis]XP_047485700.1 putative mediator of RNA polymerase II transcription subunit 26 [Penaeus chinensis]XP_047485701.1 putative mediator of RNA polymerase II transcription subunit 26 [Penaeus chinensis]XP_047485702.1 putative mediator of RNA polymerase II transcription subunit 26 [Penaeus chinensis]
MRGADRGCGSHSCSACKTFDALKAGFWSTACFFFPRPAEGSSQPLQRNRWSSRSVGHYSRASGRMGSTRPMKSGGGFIHGGFKAAALVHRSPPRPGLTRSHTTLDAGCATPYSSAHSLAHSSSGHSLALSSSSHSLAPSASSHSLASPSMTELMPSPSTRSLASSSAYSSQSSATLSRSSSNLSLGWREFRARRKPFAVLYDGQKAQSRGGVGEGLLPALRHHVLGERKARAAQNTKDSTKESSSRSTKDSVLANEAGVAARTFTKATTKAPSDAKDHKDAKGSFLSSITKNKLKGRRDDLRRFTTSVLPAHLLGLAKHAAARNNSSNNNNSTTANNNKNNKAAAGPAAPLTTAAAQHLPNKVQRLDDAGREAGAAMGPPRVYNRSVSHSAMASSRDGRRCRQGTHMSQSHENVSPAGLAGARGTPTSGMAPPKPPRTYASEGATTPRGGPWRAFPKTSQPPKGHRGSAARRSRPQRDQSAPRQA